jgi:hypothetical protein
VISFELLRQAGVLVVQPEGALSVDDFDRLSGAIDPHIRERGKLSGLLIESRAFPGWDSVGALVRHLKFVRDHHSGIERVAVVTDSAFLKIAPGIAKRLLHPEIRVFASGERAKALAWLQSGP